MISARDFAKVGSSMTAVTFVMLLAGLRISGLGDKHGSVFQRAAYWLQWLRECAVPKLQSFDLLYK